jgi:hypothetical protein
MESAAITTRRVKGMERKGDFWGVIIVFRWRGVGKYQTVHHSLSAAARGGMAMRGIAFLLLAAWGVRSCT